MDKKLVKSIGIVLVLFLLLVGIGYCMGVKASTLPIHPPGFVAIESDASALETTVLDLMWRNAVPRQGLEVVAELVKGELTFRINCGPLETDPNCLRTTPVAEPDGTCSSDSECADACDDACDAAGHEGAVKKKAEVNDDNTSCTAPCKGGKAFCFRFCSPEIGLRYYTTGK